MSTTKEKTSRDLRILEMRAEHTIAVGQLHADYMERSDLSNLGGHLLGLLYRALLKAGYGVGFVLISRDAVVGFCFGRSLRQMSMVRVVASQLKILALPLLGLVLTRPFRLARLLLRLFQPGHCPVPPGCGELVSIVVRKDVRNTELSQTLALSLFARMKADGCQAVRWETLEQNVRAQNFYRKIGGKQFGQGQVGSDVALYFERTL